MHPDVKGFLVFAIVVLIFCLLFAGEPDMWDAIIQKVMNS